MARPVITPTGDVVTSKNWRNVQECLDGGVTLDNTSGRYIEGKTGSLPDSRRYFTHGMDPQPASWFPVIGDVYIQEINSKQIDVRSTKPNVKFKIYLFPSADATKNSVVPAEDTQDTTEWTNHLIQQADGGGEVTDALTAEALSYPYSTSLGTSTTVSGNIITALANKDYIFYSSNKTTITRVTRATGFVTELNPSGGATNMGVMCFDSDPNYIWVAPGSGAGGSHTLYKIDTASWTVDSTLASSTESGAQNLSAIYANTSYVFVGGRSTNGSDRCVVWRRSKTSGVSSITLIANTNTNGGTRSIVENPLTGELFCTARQTTGIASGLYRIDSAFSSSTTISYANAANRTLVRIAFAPDTGNIICLFGVGPVNAVNRPTSALVSYDPVGASFSSTELQIPSIYQTDIADLLIKDGAAYATAKGSSVIQLLRILPTGETSTRVYPANVSANDTTAAVVPNQSTLTVDTENNLLVLFSVNNYICWFTPTPSPVST